MAMANTKYKPHFYGQVQGIVIGDNNVVTITYANGQQQTVPFLAPPQQPYKLVGRDVSLKKLKKRLFAGDTLALSALNGFPGVGKTALAVALAHDKEVMAHFTDGVLWAGLGRNADPFRHLGDWMSALGIHETEIKNARTLEERMKIIKIAINTRRMLLVVDDAWNTEDALRFKIGGPNCAHLLTTRQIHIAFDFAGNEGRAVVHELSEGKGLELLKQFAKTVVEDEFEDAKKIVKAVGGLPLALILIGKYLQKEAVSHQTSRIRRALERIEWVEERLRLEQSPASVEHHPSLVGGLISLQAVIAITDEALDKDASFALQTLSVFPPKPNTFSEEAAIFVTTKSPVVLDTMFDYGILESGGRDRYMIHQTIADYAKLKCTDKNAYERMAEFFVSFAETHRDDFDRLEKESSNILVALQVAFGQKMLLNLARGTYAFFNFMHARGLYKLAETHLYRSLEATYVLNNTDMLAKIFNSLGRISLSCGNYKEAQQYFKKSLSPAIEVGNKKLISNLFANMGTVALNLSEFVQAEKFYKEGLKGVNPKVS